MSDNWFGLIFKERKLKWYQKSSFTIPTFLILVITILVSIGILVEKFLLKW